MACDLEVMWDDVIGLEESRVVWKSLEKEWYQGTWVPHGIHMVYAWMMEIKEYDVRAHEHGMLALR